jgi:hypothetical protein
MGSPVPPQENVSSIERQLLAGPASRRQYNWGHHSAALARSQKRALTPDRISGDLHFTARYTLSANSPFGTFVRDRIMRSGNLKKKYLEQAIVVTTRALFADIYASSGRLSYSRRPVSYAAPRGLIKPFVRYAGMIAVIPALVDAGIIDSEISRPWPAGRGKQSVATLTPAFAAEAYRSNWFEALTPVQQHDFDLVVIRDRESRKILPWGDECLGKSYTAQLEAINSHLAPAYVKVPDRFVRHRSTDGEVLAIFNPANPDRAPVILAPNQRRRLYMPFLDTFDLGGRPVGWDAQIIPSLVRRHCTLLGDTVGEIDFSGSHIALAYIHQGREAPRSDPYQAICDETGLDRQIAKRTALIALNASSPDAAIGAVYRYMVDRLGHACEDKDLEYAIRADAALAYRTFRKVHGQIADLVATDFGVKAQNTEAKIMLKILHAAQRKTFHVIPMHDGVCGPERRTDEMMEIAKMAWTEVTGAKPPKIKAETREDTEGKGSNGSPHVWNVFAEQNGD